MDAQERIELQATTVESLAEVIQAAWDRNVTSHVASSPKSLATYAAWAVLDHYKVAQLLLLWDGSEVDIERLFGADPGFRVRYHNDPVVHALVKACVSLHRQLPSKTWDDEKMRRLNAEFSKGFREGGLMDTGDVLEGVWGGPMSSEAKADWQRVIDSVTPARDLTPEEEEAVDRAYDLQYEDPPERFDEEPSLEDVIGPEGMENLKD